MNDNKVKRDVSLYGEGLKNCEPQSRAGQSPGVGADGRCANSCNNYRPLAVPANTILKDGFILDCEKKVKYCCVFGDSVHAKSAKT